VHTTVEQGIAAALTSALIVPLALSSLPAEQRQIPLLTIAERTKLTVDGVEFLLMKTLSLHLIEGVIDQVDANVQVTLLYLLFIAAHPDI
jgi:hypothetical protein